MKHIKLCKPKNLKTDSKANAAEQNKQPARNARVSTLASQGLGCVPTEMVIIDRD
jgi:hypothetical protein